MPGPDRESTLYRCSIISSPVVIIAIIAVIVVAVSIIIIIL